MEGRHPKWRGWLGAFHEIKRNGAGKTENSHCILITDYLFDGSGGVESLLALFSVIFRHW